MLVKENRKLFAMKNNEKKIQLIKNYNSMKKSLEFL